MANQYDFSDPDVRQAYKNVFAKENGFDLNDPDVNGLLDKHLDSFIPPPPEKGIASETFDQGIAGFAIETPRMIGKALKYTGKPGDKLYNAGENIVKRADEAERRNPWLKPTITDKSGIIKTSLSEGARMIGPSVTVPAAVGLTAASLPVSGGAATLAAAGLGVIPMAMSQGQQTLDKAEAAGVPYEEAVKAARRTALIEGTGEAVGTFAFMKFAGFGGKLISKFGSVQDAEKAAVGILKEISDTKVVPRFLNSLWKTLAAEIGTEVGQASGQAAVEQSYGIDNVSPLEAGKSVVGPTAAMTILLGPFGANAAYQQAARNTTINRLLNDPSADPEQRVAAARLVHDQLATQNPEAAKNWAANATIAITSEQPIALDKKYIGKPESAMFDVGPLARAAEKVVPALQAEPQIYRDQPQERVTAQPFISDAEASRFEAQARLTPPPYLMQDMIGSQEDLQAQESNRLARAGIRRAYEEYAPEAPQGTEFSNRLIQEGEQAKAATARFKPTAEPLTASTDTLIENLEEIPVNKTPRTVKRKAEGGFFGAAPAPQVIRNKVYSSEGVAKNALKLLKGKINVNEYDVFPVGNGWQIRTKNDAAKAEALDQLNQNIPEDTRDAVLKMERDLAEGDKSGTAYNEKTGDTVGFSSTNPEWFKQDTISKYDKKFGTSLAGKLNKMSVAATLSKVRSNKPLTESQNEIWEYLQETANQLKNTDPEMVAGQEADKITESGIDIGPKRTVVVGDLNEGDKVVIENKGIPDVVEHKGYDEEGNVILEDGKRFTVDQFDKLDIYGEKKAEGLTRGQQIKSGDTDLTYQGKDVMGLHHFIIKSDGPANKANISTTTLDPDAIRKATDETVKKFSEGPRIAKTLGKEDMINGITRAQAGDMLADGDEAVLGHIREGMEKHGKLAMEDAIRNQEITEVAGVPKDQRGEIKEKIAKLKPQIDEILNGEAVPDAKTPAPAGEDIGAAPLSNVKEPWQMTRDEYLAPRPKGKFDYFVNQAGKKVWSTQAIANEMGWKRDVSREVADENIITTTIPSFLHADKEHSFPEGKYIYHYTPAERIAKIKEDGLSAKNRGEMVRSGGMGSRNNLYAFTHTNRDFFLNGVERDVTTNHPSGWAILRFAKGDGRWVKDKEFSDDTPSIKSKHRVDKEGIEIFTNFGWIPIIRIQIEQLPQHKYITQKALLEGKQVPPEVLAYYPELQADQPRAEAETRQPEKAGVADEKETEQVKEQGKISKGFHIRNTLVDKDVFNSLSDKKRKAIIELKKQFDSLPYIDVTTQLGPDQIRRMTDRQKEKIGQTAQRVFAIEMKVKQLIKPESELAGEELTDKLKKLLGKKLQLENYIKTLESVYAKKLESPRNNSTKHNYSEQVKELQSVNNEIAALEKPKEGDVKYSRAKKTTNTVESVTAAISGSKRVRKLLDDGRIKVVEKSADIPTSATSKAIIDPETGKEILNAAGYVKSTDTIYLSAEAIPSGQEENFLAHESWHRAEETGNLDPLLGELERLEKMAGNRGKVAEWFTKAMASARYDKGTKAHTSEIAAYAVQNYEQSPNIIKRWVDKLIAKVRTSIFQIFGIMPRKLDPAFLREIALSGLRGTVEKGGEGTVFSRAEIIKQAKAFYSKLAEVSLAKFLGMKAQGVENFLLKQGVKKIEIEATGLKEWLAGKKPTDKVTKQELLDFVKANTIALEDVILDDGVQWSADDAREFHELDRRTMAAGNKDGLNAADAKRYSELSSKLKQSQAEKKTQFSTYQEPGAEEGSYREMFVTAPKKFNKGATIIKTEFDDDAGVEFVTFEYDGEVFEGTKQPGETDADTAKRKLREYFGLAADNVWSDGHSQYSDIKNPIVRIRFNTRTDAQGRKLLFIEEMQGPSKSNQGKMPGYLKDNIYQLGVKRILAYAKENGFDGVSWTPGEMQAARYDLSKQIDEVQTLMANGKYLLTIKKDGKVLSAPTVEEDNLEDTVGKELAKKIIEFHKTDKYGIKTFTGLDLKVGGEGLKRLYDFDVPKMFEAYGKGKIEEAKIDFGPMANKNKLDELRLAWSEGRISELEYEQEKQRTKLKENIADIKFIPISDKTPDSYTVFSRVAPIELEPIESEMKDKWISGKTDINKFDRMFSTIEKYADKVPVIKRYWDIIRHRTELKFQYENSMFQIGGIDAVKQWGDLSSKDHSAFSAYMVKADAAFPRYQRRQAADGTWTAHFPNKEKMKGLTADESAQALFDKEHSDNINDGMKKAVADAVRTARMVNYASFKLNITALEAMQKQAKDAGMEEPTIPVPATNAKFKVNKKGNEDGRAFRLFSTIEDAKEFIGERKNPGEWAYSELEDTEENKVQQLKISEVLEMMGDIVGNYFPRVRKTGDYILRAYDKDGNEKYMKLFDAPFAENWDKKSAVETMKKYVNFGTGKFQKYLLGADDLHGTIREMKKKGWRVEISENTQLSEDVFEAPQLLVSMQNLLDAALESAPKDQHEAAEQLNKIVTMEIGKIFKMRGSLSSRLRRKPTVVAGYETDAIKAIISHVKSIAGGLAKRETSENAMKVILGRDISWENYKAQNEDATFKNYLAMTNERRLDPGKQKEAYGAVMANFEWSMRNQTKLDRVVGTLKGLATLKYLGFRLSSPAVNMTNMLSGVPAAMHANGVSFGRAALELRKAATSYVVKRSAGDARIFDYISAKGWDAPQFNQDASGFLQSQAGRGYDKIMSWAMFIFSATEKFNRATTIAASYRALGGKSDVIDKAIMEKARDISDEAHGVYQKETLPEWAMGEGFPAAMARTGYTFTKFTHNYLLNLKRYGFEGKDRKAAAMLLISPAIMSGITASAVTPLIMAIARALGEDEPEEDFYKWVEENTGIPDVITRQGLAGALGIDIRGSLGVRYGLPTTMKELLGAPYSVIEDVVTGVGKLAKGEVMKGVEKIIPAGIGAPLKALREYSEGLTTESNQKVFGTDNIEIKGSGIDAAIRAMTFNPARLAAEREKIWNTKQKTQYYSKAKSKIYSDMRRYLLKKERNISDWAELLMRVEDYNNNVVDRKEDALITSGQIKSLIKQMRVKAAKEQYLSQKKMAKYKLYEMRLKYERKKERSMVKYSD